MKKEISDCKPGQKFYMLVYMGNKYSHGGMLISDNAFVFGEILKVGKKKILIKSEYGDTAWIHPRRIEDFVTEEEYCGIERK